MKTFLSSIFFTAPTGKSSSIPILNFIYSSYRTFAFAILKAPPITGIDARAAIPIDTKPKKSRLETSFFSPVLLLIHQYLLKHKSLHCYCVNRASLCAETTPDAPVFIFNDCRTFSLRDIAVSILIQCGKGLISFDILKAYKPQTIFRTYIGASSAEDTSV